MGTSTRTPESELQLSRAMSELYARAVRSETDGELYCAISAALPDLFPCDRASVTLVIKGTNELEVLGLEGDVGTIPLGQRLSSENSGPGAAIRSRGLERWRAAEMPDRFPALLKAGLDGTMSAPLVVLDEVVGAVNVARADGGYSEEQGDVFSEVAKLISTNLERFSAVTQIRERLAETEARRRQLEGMSALGRGLSAARSESVAFQVAADVVGSVINADRVSLVVPNSESDTVIVGLRNAGGSPGGLGLGASVPTSGSAIGRVLEEGEVVCLSDLDLSDYSEHRILAGQGLRSALSLPIHAGESVAAVMSCAAVTRDAYSDDDLAIARSIANTLGETLERIRAQDRLADQNRELVRLSDSLEHEATHDVLTGLVNRRQFDRALGDLLQPDSDASPGSLVFLDIDHFKLVNDSAGHRAGDELLKRLAEALSRSLDRGDTLSRLGGDEFAVLLPGCSLTNAVQVAERLRATASEVYFAWEGRTFDVSVSLGVSPIPARATDPDEVLGLVDAACYGAKRSGRDRVSVGSAQDGSEPSARSDRDWAHLLRRALDGDEFHLFAQPIVGTNGDGDVRGAEILLRLPDDGGEMISAGSFIPAAERLGLITEIDAWVVSRVVDKILRPGALAPSISFLTVNLSPQSIESDVLLDHLVTELSAPGIEAERLVFEITERGAMSDFSRALRCIEAVSALGCRFALDDFGVGFSTYDYLRRLKAVDFIKIDGSLVQGVEDDLVARSIVRSIAQVATELGMATVAECVEDRALLEELDRAGAGYAQGFGLGRPEPIEGFLVD